MKSFKQFCESNEDETDYPDMPKVPHGVWKRGKDGYPYVHTKYHNMPKEKISHHLDKTRDSIRAHKSRGGDFNTQRGYELADRYDNIKDAAERAGHWETHNKERGTVNHSGVDLYA